MDTSTLPPLIPSSTGPYAGPPSPLDGEQTLRFRGCVSHLTALVMSPPLAVADIPPLLLGGAVIRWALDQIFHWQALAENADFLRMAAGRMTDQHYYAVFEATGINDHQLISQVRDAAASEGGLAAAVTTHLVQLRVELDAQVAYFASVLGHFSGIASGLVLTDEPAPTRPTDSPLGCAMGALEAAAGAIIVVDAGAAKVATGGAVAPVVTPAALAGVALLGTGLSQMGSHCF